MDTEHCNKSILADPPNPNIKNIINRTIKMRKILDFAPSVLEKHYKELGLIHHNRVYMSRIMPVKKPKQVPGITHIRWNCKNTNN